MLRKLYDGHVVAATAMPEKRVFGISIARARSFQFPPDVS